MSILIKIEMPRGCYQCLFMTHCEECEGHPNHCILDEDKHGFGNHLFSSLEWKYPIVPMERPSWCPLVEVKPHGRLIDADALRVDYFAPSFTSNMPNYYHVSKAQIDNAPTIIESEGEE